MDVPEPAERLEFSDPAERTLAKMILRFPDTVASAARALEPHRLIYYTLDLANTFHAFYEQARVVSDDAAATASASTSASGRSQIMRQTLNLVGVSAPEECSNERED